MVFYSYRKGQQTCSFQQRSASFSHIYKPWFEYLNQGQTGGSEGLISSCKFVTKVGFSPIWIMPCVLAWVSTPRLSVYNEAKRGCVSARHLILWLRAPLIQECESLTIIYYRRTTHKHAIWPKHVEAMQSVKIISSHLSISWMLKFLSQSRTSGLIFIKLCSG